MGLDTKGVQLIISDFDGVLTDNFVYLDSFGDESVRCCKSDSAAIQELYKIVPVIMVLSNEKSLYVRHRCRKIHVMYIQAIDDKVNHLNKICMKQGVKPIDILYIGNDLNDLQIMKSGVRTCCPSDSVQEIRDIVDLVLKTRGGYGVFRELLSLFKGNA